MKIISLGNIQRKFTSKPTNEQTNKPTNQQTSKPTNAFTLLELLIVISIIAILAATIVPNFIGFDAEARISAAQTNLNTLRTRVALYRAKEGEYPHSLDDLLTKTYDDMGVEQFYLEKIPPEMISTKSGDSSFDDLSVEDELDGDGGWVYYQQRAKVVLDIDEALGKKWGKFKDEVPSEW